VFDERAHFPTLFSSAVKSFATAAIGFSSLVFDGLHVLPMGVQHFYT
jgi:hypothetical protein